MIRANSELLYSRRQVLQNIWEILSAVTKSDDLVAFASENVRKILFFLTPQVSTSEAWTFFMITFLWEMFRFNTFDQDQKWN